MRSIFLTIFALLLFAPVFTPAQTLPSTFTFARENADDGGILYSLSLNAGEIIKKRGVNTPYQIVGAVARPDTGRAVIIFANAQKKFQLAAQRNKSVSIIADGEIIEDLEYEMAAQTEEDTVIKLEIGNTLMSYKEFEKVMNAGSVTVTYGAVSYRLDKDNIAALRYLAAQIEKDNKKTRSSGAPR